MDRMKIESADFVKGIRGTDDILYDGFRQIAFFGRSNVGKSSVINSLVNRNNLVKVGKKPGKTTEINFFRINHQFYFVDLPGYGYALLNPKAKEKIKKLIYWYLTYSEVKIFKAVLILDIKVGLTDFDRETIGIFKEHGHPYIVVANKIDKLNQRETARQIDFIKKACPEAEVIPYSAETKQGTEVLLEKLVV